MEDVKEAAAGTPLQGFPELFNPDFSDKNGLGAAANRSLLLSVNIYIL